MKLLNITEIIYQINKNVQFVGFISKGLDQKLTNVIYVIRTKN